MKQIVLIFSISVLILLLGLLFGYKQFKKDFTISSKVKELALPLEVELDTDFIRKKSF